MSGGDQSGLKGGLPGNVEAASGVLDGHVVACVSWGNDSIALVQHLHEEGLTDVTCLYNDTGWPGEGWTQRVERCEAWAQSLGFQTARTSSEGMEALVVRKQAWPRQGMQFCTWELKIGPTIEWLSGADPEKLMICANGKRRAESQERSNTVEWIEESAAHDGRRLWQPLHDHDAQARDDLIRRAGFEVLPHKSRECRLCVNSNRVGLAKASEADIAWVERVEARLGVSAKTGKAKTMFRPARKMGATGIREVVEWAKSAPGKYVRGTVDLFSLDDGTGPSESATGCEPGFCEVEDAA